MKLSNPFVGLLNRLMPPGEWKPLDPGEIEPLFGLPSVQVRSYKEWLESQSIPQLPRTALNEGGWQDRHWVNDEMKGETR